MEVLTEILIIRHLIIKNGSFYKLGRKKHFNYNKKFTPLPSPQLKRPKLNFEKIRVFCLFQKNQWVSHQNIIVCQA